MTRLHPRFSLLSGILLLTALLLSFPAQAGLISSIFKAANKVDVDTGDLRKLDVDLPTDKDTLVGKAYLDSQGEWQIRLPDKPPGTSGDKGRKVALLIEERDLPDSLDQLAMLPDQYTILIKQKKKALELRRTPDWHLRHKQLEIAITDMQQLRSASWHLQRPCPVATSA